MTSQHAERSARVRQLQALEQQLAALRPQVEQDLRDVIEELQDAGVSQKRIGEQINRSKTVIHHIAAGDRRELQSLSTWVAQLLTYQEAGPNKPKGKPRGKAAKMRGDK